LEGTPVATLSTPFNQTVTKTYRTTVADGQLTVRFKDLGGSTPVVGINAMSVIRVTESLSMSINPTTIAEPAGPNAATGTVTRTGDLTTALVVTLSSSDTTEATVPATVTIPAGQPSATFPIAAVNDAIIDGTQTATISATAIGYAVGSANVSVTDDDQNPGL